MLAHLREYGQIDWGRASIDSSSAHGTQGARKRALTLRAETSAVPSEVLRKLEVMRRAG